MMREKLQFMWQMLKYSIEPEEYREGARLLLHRETWKDGAYELRNRWNRKDVQRLVVNHFFGTVYGNRAVHGSRSMTVIYADDHLAINILAAMTAEELGPTSWQGTIPVLATVIYGDSPDGDEGPPFPDMPLPTAIGIYPVPFPYARIQYYLLNALFAVAMDDAYTDLKYNAVLNENYTENSIFNEIFVADDDSGEHYRSVAKLDPVNLPGFYGPGEFFSIPLNQPKPVVVVDLTRPSITADERRIDELEREFESYIRTHPEAPDNYMLVSVILGKSDEYYRLLEEFEGL